VVAPIRGLDECFRPVTSAEELLSGILLRAPRELFPLRGQRRSEATRKSGSSRLTVDFEELFPGADGWLTLSSSPKTDYPPVIFHPGFGGAS